MDENNANGDKNCESTIHHSERREMCWLLHYRGDGIDVKKRWTGADLRMIDCTCRGEERT